MSDFGVLLSALVQKEPGVIIGPIATVFGYVIDFIFNIVYFITVENSLGLSIVLLTIIFRLLMLPLTVRSQKSMNKMQKLNPEVEKIRARYGGSKDPEIQQKMNMEIQALYSKNKVNPLGGCLPIFIQFPLFFGINYIMQQSYLFIPRLHEIYSRLSGNIILAFSQSDAFLSHVIGLAYPHLPKDMTVDLKLVDDLSKVINKFSIAEWDSLFSAVPAGFEASIQEFYHIKQSVEMFFGLPLIDAVGFMFPGILIPILAGLSSVATAWLGNKTQPEPADDKARTQRTMMLVVMPIIMTVMTFSLPGGVGIYWITGSVFQIIQQIVMNQKAGVPLFKKKKSD